MSSVDRCGFLYRTRIEVLIKKWGDICRPTKENLIRSIMKKIKITKNMIAKIVLFYFIGLKIMEKMFLP